MAIHYNPTTVSDGLVLALDAANTRSYGGSGTTWTDVSYNGNNGTLTNGPTFEPGGPFAGSTGGSVYFDGSGGPTSTGSNLEFSSTITLGTGDFTVETWIYNTVASQRMEVWQNSSLIGAFAVSTDFNASDAMNILTRSSPPGSGWSRLLRADTELQHNSWNHIAWVRSGGTLTAYLNGVADGNISSSIDSSPLLTIGGWSTGTNYMFGGNLSNLRIIKGTALYTSNFTPPTKPLTPVSGTSLLTCQGGAIVDNSSNKFSITKNGDARAIQSASIKFDGVSDYASVSHNPSWDIGSTPKTIECWIYLNSVVNGRLIMGQVNQWWLSVGWTLVGVTSGKFGISFLDTSSWRSFSSSTSVSSNEWYNVVVTWDGTFIRLFVNGNLETTSSNLSAVVWASSSNSTLDIGSYSGASTTYAINGRVSNSRIYNKALSTQEVQQNFNALRGRFGV